MDWNSAWLGPGALRTELSERRRTKRPSEKITVTQMIDGLISRFGGSPRTIRQAFVDGGQVNAQFLAAGHVSETRIITLPVLLGDGIWLFEKPISTQAN